MEFAIWKLVNRGENKMEENNKKCLEIIENLGLNPRIEKHEPILNFETAIKVDEELGFNGHETKSLFLKGKSGKYYIFITLMEERMDSKLIKELVGEKVNMVSGEEMTNLTGMEPGCMTPFGLKEGLIDTLIVDSKVYKEEKLILAFGTSRMSMEIKSNELKTLLEYSHKNIIMLNE